MIFKKAYFFYRSNTLVDFIRKGLYYFYITFNFTQIFRRIKAYIYFKDLRVSLGSNVKIHGIANNLKFGINCVIYDNCIFEFSEMSNLSIGDNFLLSYGSLISCRNLICVGNDVQIGEYTSIRDSTHDYSELGVSIKYNKDISKEIIIGNNVWIGRGCIILPGTIIEDGVVVGANSIIKGRLIKDSVYVGNPIKFIKNRL